MHRVDGSICQYQVNSAGNEALGYRSAQFPLIPPKYGYSFKENLLRLELKPSTMGCWALCVLLRQRRELPLYGKGSYPVFIGNASLVASELACTIL